MKAWHLEARKMRAEGWKIIAIAAHFRVSDSAVCYALNPTRAKAYALAYYWRNCERLKADHREWFQIPGVKERQNEKAKRRRLLRKMRANGGFVPIRPAAMTEAAP